MNLAIRIDRASGVPVHRQVYDWIRGEIRGGHLAPGTRLPSTRQLAQQLGIARSTLITVYEHLVADGYLEARVGEWTSVALDPPKDTPVDAENKPVYGSEATPRANKAGAWLNDWTATLFGHADGALPYDFRRAFTPAVDAFPTAEWRRLVAAHWRESTPHSVVDFYRGGVNALRQEISRYLHITRGIECDIDQVILTTGSEQALDIVSKILLMPGDRVVVEEPSSSGVRNVFRVYGAEVVPVPVDDDGLVVDALATLTAPSPVLVHVTPTCQFPTGVTLVRQRRLDLLRWAVQRHALILEDDNDSEFTYEAGVEEALRSLDSAGVVAYMGTFAKVLSPSIQLGYLVVPTPLAESAAAVQRLVTRPAEVVHQAVLARFMQQGGLSRHLRRLHRIHRARRDALITALRDEFGSEVLIGPARAGLQLCVRWPRYPVTPEIMSRARAAGIGLLPVRPMYINPPEHDPGVVMSYASLPEETIKEGVALLASILRGADSQGGAV